MPTLIERARMGLVNALAGDEIRRLEQAVGVLQHAYYEGPFALPPRELMRQLGEVDPWLIQDYLQQMGWDVIGYSFQSGAERQRAVQESRRLYKYSPMAQWAIWMWTSWGLGESVHITLDNDKAGEAWREFWDADRNQAALSADCVHELSNWLLIDGNLFLTFYASSVNGDATVGEIDPAEITEIVYAPGNSKRPLFYKREWMEQKTGAQQTWYYPDWQAFLTGELDEPWQGGDKTLAQTVLPTGAYRADLGRKMGADATLGDEGKPYTAVCVLHLHHNHKERGGLWGWPLLATDASWLKAHKRFMESRLAVAESKALYVRRYKTGGGSRAVSAIKDTIASNLSHTSSSYDTNPPAAPGSSEVTNRAVDVEDLPMSTGAGDARADNNLFAWHALLGAGLFPASAGLDVMRYATALAMDKSQSMLFTRYQTYWSAQFRKVVRIVLGLKEKFGGEQFGEWTADVSIDLFSLADFPDVAKTLGSAINSMLTPLVEGGICPVPLARQISAALWRVTLQSLNVAGVDDLTSDEAWGLTQEPQDGGVVEQIAQQVAENAAAGDVDWQRIAEWALDTLRDTGG